MQIDIKIQALERTKQRFAKLQESISDLRPIWKPFLNWYKHDYMPAVFKTRGTALGERWKPYKHKWYVNWKKKHGNKPMLRLKDKLYEAVQGGPGWYEKLSKKNLIFGINKSIIKYANSHQYGSEKQGIAQRQYFYKNNDLSPRAWSTLLKITNETLQEKLNDK